MSNLAQVLLSAQKGDANSHAASEILTTQSHQNPAQFMLELSAILADESSLILARQIAGIALKNTVNNANNDPYLEEIWYKIDPEAKPQIRNNVLATLASPDRNVRLTAAQSVACIAKKDIPRGEWLEILNILITNATNLNPMFKQASLMTLGYICEDLPPECIGKELSDRILTAIAANLTPEEPDADVKQIALQALRNSLPFTKANFMNETEKQVIIDLICNACQASVELIRLEAFQALCDIAYIYYEYLSSALFQLGNVTYTAIQHDEQAIAVLGIEFWNVIADIEVVRIQGGQPINGFINTAANTLVPILLAKIVVYEDEDDDWNLHKASSSCISVIAQIIKDPIVDLLHNFISKEIRSPNWKNRDSAALLLGSIVDGPSESKLSPLITSGVEALKNLMTDPSLAVRQTSAWSISKICEIQYKIMTQPGLFNPIVPKLIESLKDHPKVACHCCWALINLVDHCSEVSLFRRDIVNLLLSSLLDAAYRQDSFNTEHNLQLSAYSAVNTVIEKAPNDCVPIFEQRIPSFIDQLRQSISVPKSEQVQAFICSALQACFARASQASITDETARVFMDTLIQIFNLRGSVIEDGMQAAGALAMNIEGRFIMFMDQFTPFVAWALNKNDSMSICRAGTMCVGDLARALKEKIGPYILNFVPPLLRNLESDVVSTDVKVLSIESLGDFAAHTKKLFMEYLGSTIGIIEGAANASVQQIRETENPDLFDYLCDLREVILEFYVSLLQGLGECGQIDLLLGNMQSIVNYTMMTVSEAFKPNKNHHANAIGLLGDIAGAYGKSVVHILRTPIINTYLQQHKTGNDPMLREMANYAIQAISSN